ncbi:MAG: O-antigen ligase family protein [Rhodospirillales bacterium]
MATAPRTDLSFLFWTLLIVVVAAPLPFGSVDGWSWALLATVVGALLAVWSAQVLLGRKTPAFGLRSLWPLLLLFAAAVLWAWLQAARGWLPALWQHPLWELTGEALGWDLKGAVSIDPYETGAAIIRLLTYAGVFWLALQFGQRNIRARQGLIWVSYAGMAYAFYGLIMYFLGLDLILFFQKTAYLDDLTSTFVNRNSYATFAGLGLICTSGLIMVMITQTVAGGRTAGAEGLLRVIETVAEKGWPLVVGWLAQLLALFLSHSRGGLLATLLGLVAFLAAAAGTRAVDRRLALTVGGIGGVLLAGFLLINGEAVVKRLLTTSFEEEDRPLVYERVTDAIHDAGSLGTGYGTFEEVFRFYRTPDIEGTFAKAHNVYLENLLELGIPAALALFAVVAGLALLCVVGIRRRRQNSVYPCVGIGVTVLVAAHAIVDFSLQIPAVTITYAFLMGIAVAQCWSSRRAEDPW